MAIFGPKPWVNFFGKMSIFRLFELVVFLAQKGFFLVLEYHKRHFPCLYCLKNKNWKNGHFWYQNHGFGQKPWKNINFSTFGTCSFYSLERRFLVLEYHKTHFSGLYCLKKKVGKMVVFGPKPWVTVTPFEIWQFFDLFNLLFLQPRQACFRSRIL